MPKCRDCSKSIKKETERKNNGKCNACYKTEKKIAQEVGSWLRQGYAGGVK